MESAFSGSSLDSTPVTSLVQNVPTSGSSAGVVPAGSGGSGAPATFLAPTSFARSDPVDSSTTPAYIPPSAHGPHPSVARSMYPEPVRATGTHQQPQPGAAAGHYVAPAPNGPPAHQPFDPRLGPRPPLGGGYDVAGNPRLDPAGETFTHIPAYDPYLAHQNKRIAHERQVELAEFQESKRRAALYARTFQSGLFPFLAGLLFLLVTSAPVNEAVLRVFGPFGLLHETGGGGLTLAGNVVLSALFGFLFSFAVYLV